MTKPCASCAQFISENHNLIFSKWEKLAQSRLIASQRADNLALRNHLPALLVDLCVTLKRMESTGSCKEAAVWGFDPSTSEEHGRHRAATSHYTVEQLVEEYALLRQTITELLTDRGHCDLESVEAISRIVEMATVKAVSSFEKSIKKTQRRVIGALAHDIRNPLSVTRQSLEILQEELGEKNSDSRMLIEMAQRNLDRSLNMLEEILDVIRLDAGAGINLIFGEHDFVEVMDSICSEAQLVYREPILFNSPEKPIPGIFDQAGMRRVIENLISNAVKYGQRGTPVTIAVEEKGDEISISVHNEGNPITEKEKTEIFEFLARSKSRKANSGRSWGMGLSIVKIIAKAHKGDVTIESDPHDGTTFCVSMKKFPREVGESSAVLFQ